MEEISLISQIGDMKEINYKNTLAIASIIEILLEKNIITYADIKNKVQELDEMAFMEANVQQNVQK